MRIFILLLLVVNASISLVGAGYTSRDNDFSIVFPDGWDAVTPIQANTEVKARAPKGYAAVSIYRPQELLWGKFRREAYGSVAEFLQKTPRSEIVKLFEITESRQGAVASISRIEPSKAGNADAIMLETELRHDARNVRLRIRYYIIPRKMDWLVIAAATDFPTIDLVAEELAACLASFQSTQAK